MLPTSHCGVWRRQDGERYREKRKQPMRRGGLTRERCQLPVRADGELREEEVVVGRRRRE
jgi:hypothetical protein